MSTLYNEVNSIEKKVLRLLKNHNETLEENKHLKSEVEELKDNISSQKKEIQKLHKTNKMNTIQSHLVGNADESKKMISELIREIDKCVAELND